MSTCLTFFIPIAFTTEKKRYFITFCPLASRVQYGPYLVWPNGTSIL